MSRKHPPSGEPRDAWKNKMGPEFSGFERTRDFLVALLALAILIGVAMVIAFVAFG
jgi:hypothetical protein